MLNFNDIITLDFESEKIEDRPKYPPNPVGLAIKDGRKKPEYLGFFHDKGFPHAGNNSTPEIVRRRLQQALESNRPLLFHHGKFDLEIITHYFQLPMPSWKRVHDTMLLAYLDNPHNRNIDLKSLGKQYLEIEPNERDELRAWIMANVPEAKGKPKTWKEWGAYISRAPVKLVAPYACYDVNTTHALFCHLFPRVVGEGDMGRPYARELRLIEPLLENERRGVKVDYPLLSQEREQYDAQLAQVDVWLRKKLKAPGLDVDKNAELVDALLRSGLCREEDFMRTEKTGEISTSKASLEQGVKDPVLMAVLEYRATMATCLRTFIRPWHDTATSTGPRSLVYFNWNSTKQDGEGGTRTGRLSSSPNAQNMPSDENLEKAERGVLKHRLKFPQLPRIRRYIIADTRDHVLCDRDFSQQELRMLAHYEAGSMQAAYLENPGLDLHDYAAELIRQRTGMVLDPDPKRARKITKTIAFGLLYGMGDGALARKLGVTVDTAKGIKRAYLNTFPGVKELMDDLKWRSKVNDYMTTWGGRRYYAEPPKVINGNLKEFGYKLVNYLIQGSSADFTKEAILRYWEMKQHGRFLLTVHDEMMICAERRYWREEMAILREAMNDIPNLEVPMLSDGKYGERWFEMEECA